MHEISLIRNIFRTLEEEFPKQELEKLSAIDLKIGLLSNVEPLLMHNAMKAVTEAEGRFQQVSLNIEKVDIEIFCVCGKPNNNVVQGTELLIHRVHF